MATRRAVDRAQTGENVAELARNGVGARLEVVKGAVIVAFDAMSKVRLGESRKHAAGLADTAGDRFEQRVDAVGEGAELAAHGGQVETAREVPHCRLVDNVGELVLEAGEGFGASSLAMHRLLPRRFEAAPLVQRIAEHLQGTRHRAHLVAACEAADGRLEIAGREVAHAARHAQQGTGGTDGADAARDRREQHDAAEDGGDADEVGAEGRRFRREPVERLGVGHSLDLCDDGVELSGAPVERDGIVAFARRKTQRGPGKLLPVTRRELDQRRLLAQRVGGGRALEAIDRGLEARHAVNKQRVQIVLRGTAQIAIDKRAHLVRRDPNLARVVDGDDRIADGDFGLAETEDRGCGDPCGGDDGEKQQSSEGREDLVAQREGRKPDAPHPRPYPPDHRSLRRSPHLSYKQIY